VYGALFEMFSFTQLEALPFFSIVTLLLATCTLLVATQILEILVRKPQQVFWGIVFISTTFSFLKYSQEFEAYILPIFVSCVGTFYYLKGYRMLSAILLGIACVFHQIHIFWLGGMFIADALKKPRNSIYLLLGLSVPVFSYIVYANIHSMALSHLLFHDVEQGLVQVYPNLNNLLFLVVNAVRSVLFIQSETISQLKEWNVEVWIFAMLLIALLISGLVILIKSGTRVMRINAHNKPILIVLVLQFLFAAYSVGNIEFMVMIPILLVFLMSAETNLKGYARIVMGLSLWNVTQFVIPQNTKTTNFLAETHQFLQANKLDDSNLIITEQPDYLINYLEYHQLINSEKQSTANIVGDNSNLDSLLTLHSYNSVYIIKPKKQVLNRFSITHNAQFKFTLTDRYTMDTVEHFALEVIKIRQIITNSSD